MIIGTDLNWKEQTQAKLKECGSRPAALRNVQTLVTKSKRKELAQSIVLSRLEYALEVTSTGRAKDMRGGSWEPGGWGGAPPRALRS